MGMPRRYHVYPPEFQVLNVLSSAGASILGLGYLIPFFYLLWSLKYGPNRAAESVGREGAGVADGFAAADEEAYDYAKHEEVARWLIRFAVAEQHPPIKHHFDDMRAAVRFATLGMWVFLLTEIMFFGGMFGAIHVYRNMYPEAFASTSNFMNPCSARSIPAC
jgi:heme/copper-type cytochrome/quinol oxidase subunit 1